MTKEPMGLTKLTRVRKMFAIIDFLKPIFL